ncbi:MAG: hypothetical protein IPF54_14490 [Draconibacterium sp.]|nr:hypothetical protein [Draconibacterium sp.]
MRKTFGDYTDSLPWTTYNSCDGILSDYSFAIAEDKNGEIWSTDFWGVSRFDGTNWATNTIENGLAANYHWAMSSDLVGNIWLTSAYDSVITSYDGIAFVNYPQPANYEECIYADTKVIFGLVHTMETVLQV